ncbi:two-component sensor histidine kinase [Lysobacter helvus]|uniref:histidine kinase n=2 Tax=Lysobacteraceae TaxID=32033 RepID=A0ABM7Q7A8_9GAMM|nr:MULTISPECIES: HAMP domain-containing sensor histidine kinase [Lysobacter]BCT93127.1 two-component sensor histidine kinase [Lysobacter caseinilyticus]BCT96279.1 two-component sensor histidine kinase [Lysobacter helvus]
MSAWRHARSTTVRLAVAVSLSFLLGFALLGGSVYAAVSALLLRDAREAIVVDADGLRDVLADGGRAPLILAVRDRIARPDDPDALHALRIDGRVIASDIPAAATPARDGWHESREPDGTRLLVERRTLAPGVEIATGLRLRSESGFLALVARTSLAALAIAVLLGLAIGALISRWVARRLRALDATAARVTEGEIALRVPVDGTGDAFDRLAHRFNAMLDRIEALLAGVREATDHIAHDLRTPLGRLRTRLEQLRLQATVSPDALEPAIAEADQLLQASNALLRLARIEAQAPIEQAATLDLSALARDAMELYEPIAAERGITLAANAEVLRVRGDADQVFQLLVNLLDNAMKYAPPGTQVDLRVERTGEHACLTVADRGPGIPAAERERVFDRFHRIETDRGTPGSGLGLSLVRAIALRHRARIALADNGPGLRATVSFPLAAGE